MSDRTGAAVADTDELRALVWAAVIHFGDSRQKRVFRTVDFTRAVRDRYRMPTAPSLKWGVGVLSRVGFVQPLETGKHWRVIG